MIIQVVWLLLCVIAGIGLCVIFTALGNRASSVLTLQYENWRKHRNDDVKYHPKEHLKYGVRHHSERSSVAGIPNLSKHYENDDGYKESDEHTHEVSISGGK